MEGIMEITRRDFMKYLTASAVTLGLSNLQLSKVEQALAAASSPPVIWLAGAEDFNAKLTTRISLAPKRVIFVEAGGQLSTITPSFIYDAETATYDLDFNEDIPDVDLNVIPPV